MKSLRENASEAANIIIEQSNRITELQARIAQLEQECAWQPIETAPIDGTRILLCNNDSDSAVGFWVPAEDDGVDCMGDDGGFVDIEYQTFKPARSFGMKSHQYEGNQPTHWMPLPKAPA